jgi:hypothetical protein
MAELESSSDNPELTRARGSKKLPWKKVLENKSFFPRSTVGSSNEIIIKSLSEGISHRPEIVVKEVSEFIKTFQNFQALRLLSNPSSSCLLPYVEKFGKLKVTKRWEQYIQQICDNISNLQQNPNDSESISGIDTAARLLRDDAIIYKRFRDLDNTMFKGVLL